MHYKFKARRSKISESAQHKDNLLSNPIVGILMMQQELEEEIAILRANIRKRMENNNASYLV